MLRSKIFVLVQGLEAIETGQLESVVVTAQVVNLLLVGTSSK